MTANEWMLIGVWISLLLGLGGLVFPLVWRYFGQRLADGGFGVSVTAGIVLTGWITFMMASLRLAGFGFWGAGISLGLVGLFSGLILWKNKEDLARFIRRKRILLLIELGILVVSVVGWSAVRGFQPDIAGLEKFMDAGFVNAILRSKWMPPTDMWLSGYKINYYYFGHFLTAFLTLLSGIDSAYTYNLMLATVFGLMMVGSFSFVFNFLATRFSVRTRLPRSPDLVGVARNDSKIVVIALLTAVFLNFGGNLHTAWHFLSRQTKPYWYPDATRFIEYTIHEFPMYSHTVADLHGHLIDVPIVLLFLTALIAFFQGLTLAYAKVRPFEYLKFPVILGFLLGIMSMTNTWDVPIYGLVLAIIVARSSWLAARGSIKSWLWRILPPGIVTILIVIVVSLPFTLNFKNITQGVALVETRSPLWQLGVLWGGFGAIGAVAIVQFSSLAKFARSPSPVANAPGKPLASLGVASDGSSLTRKFANFATTLPLVMVGVSALLIVIPEFIYVKDIYIKEYHRANTMFKLTYQSFVMMSLVWGMALGSVASQVQSSKFKVQSYISLILLLLVFSAHMAYPFFAIGSYYNGLKKFQGLYGLQWLARQYPNDYQVINWMKANIPPASVKDSGEAMPVILEAVGESYTDHARVSAFTGLPTVLGWRVHEWLWRGSFDIPGQRTEEVKTMYEKPNSLEAAKLFKQYQVKYIFVGDLERTDYRLNEGDLGNLGRVIFQSRNSYLIEI